MNLFKIIFVFVLCCSFIACSKKIEQLSRDDNLVGEWIEIYDPKTCEIERYKELEHHIRFYPNGAYRDFIIAITDSKMLSMYKGDILTIDSGVYKTNLAHNVLLTHRLFYKYFSSDSIKNKPILNNEYKSKQVTKSEYWFRENILIKRFHYFVFFPSSTSEIDDDDYPYSMENNKINCVEKFKKNDDFKIYAKGSAGFFHDVVFYITGQLWW